MGWSGFLGLGSESPSVPTGKVEAVGSSRRYAVRHPYGAGDQPREAGGWPPYLIVGAPCRVCRSAGDKVTNGEASPVSDCGLKSSSGGSVR